MIDLPEFPSDATVAALNIINFSAVMLEKISVYRLKACHLQCPSGRIVACDPIGDFAQRPFAAAIEKGRHLVNVYVHHHPKWGPRVALAQILLSQKTARTWKLAETERARNPSEHDIWVRGFCVDSAKGCFIDAENAVAIAEHERATGTTYVSEDVFEDIICIDHEPEQHRLTFDAKRNMAIFSTGFGDGIYQTFWGLDSAGRPASLVTSFGVMEDNFRADGIPDVDRDAVQDHTISDRTPGSQQG